MRYPEEFIERLRNHLPISQVISKRIPIRRHGREFQALCPFHKEKTPSFTINDDKGFFHCFGCGAHGDAIGFIRDYEGVRYPEAIERLAAEAGIPLPKITREAEEEEQRRTSLHQLMEKAAGWFSEQLRKPAAREAQEYLAGRGLKADMVERFGLGFAPNQRDGLKTAFTRQGISEAQLLEVGLLAKADDGMTYDRFRGRLMFPIRNVQGKVIAFGGRILPSVQTEKTAKYLNSPETPLFKKGENLFAYHSARTAAREKGNLIVAEGYMDVIALHSAGFTNSVAPLGTAITESQLKLLWRTVSEPVLCLDGDAAGKRAMMRAAELALPHIRPGVSLRFAYLPAGEDPDSLIRRRGAAAFSDAMEASLSLSEALWQEALARFGSTTAEQRAALEHHLTEQAHKVADKLVSQHMLGYFREQVFALGRQKIKGAALQAKLPVARLPAVNAPETSAIITENQMVSVIILHPSLLQDVTIEERFISLEFTQSVLDKLRAHILEIHSCSQSLDSATLCAAMEKRGLGEKVKTLLHSEKPVLSMSFRTRITSDASAALQAFEKAFFAYQIVKAEQDIAQASKDYEIHMTEANQTRLYELQQYKQSLEKSRYSVSHDEQFS